MTLQDVADLWEAIRQIPASSEVSAPNRLDSVLANPRLLPFWQILFFRPEEFTARPGQTDAWNRGAYIVNGPGHCTECHTPRSSLGQLEQSQHLAGALLPPKGEKVPAITSEALKRAGWTNSDLPFGLKFGILPDGDVMGGSMGEVIEGSLSHLSNDDIAALVTYLMTGVENPHDASN
jgi:mono/diheme cytochrome c family protein